jgi:hypothetical protein
MAAIQSSSGMAPLFHDVFIFCKYSSTMSRSPRSRSACASSIRGPTMLIVPPPWVAAASAGTPSPVADCRCAARRVPAHRSRCGWPPVRPLFPGSCDRPVGTQDRELAYVFAASSSLTSNARFASTGNSSVRYLNLDREAAVSPELSLATETVRCL